MLGSHLKIKHRKVRKKGGIWTAILIQTLLKYLFGNEHRSVKRAKNERKCDKNNRCFETVDSKQQD